MVEVAKACEDADVNSSGVLESKCILVKQWEIIRNVKKAGVP